jgi:hypothetical protein
MNMGLAVLRDISLIWLIFLTLISVLPFAALFFFLVKGMHRLRQVVKQYLPVGQDYARLVATRTEEISTQIAAPVIKAHAKSAQVNAIAKSIFGRNDS